LVLLKISNAEFDGFMIFPALLVTLLLKLKSECADFICDASLNLAGRKFQSNDGGKPCSAIRGASGIVVR
jgi:hypothetical protein